MPLQESSTNWVPNWARDRVKPVKNTSGTGHSFFLERSTLEKVCADAKLWAASALRVYMITGAPGVGKSEFTIWLAAQFDLPVYRLCLTNPRLTDDRLAQLLSQSAVTHNSMLVQVDEFQEAVRHWMQSKTSTGDSSAGVTPGGFCEVLQGSTAMGRGVIVLTGTCEIVDEQVMRRLPAAFSAHSSIGPLELDVRGRRGPVLQSVSLAFCTKLSSERVETLGACVLR